MVGLSSLVNPGTSTEDKLRKFGSWWLAVDFVAGNGSGVNFCIQTDYKVCLSKLSCLVTFTKQDEHMYT